MIQGILDTTVVLHLFRRYPPALAWYDTPQRHGITTITWLEVMEGTRNKAHQSQCKLLLSKFELLYPTAIDQRWAMEQLEQLQFTHHVGKEDCLIASVAFRLQLPLYTHNVKDMAPMLGSLVIQPYA